MDNSYIEDLRKQVKKALKEDKMRYRHTLGVADTSACLAMRYGENMQKAYIAGLLHDCAKCVPDTVKLEECNRYGIEVTEFEKNSLYLLHAKLGAYYAKELYHIEDASICSAIYWHTTGHAGMTKLEEIVYIADYIEPYRNHAQNLDTIRQLAFMDLERAIYQVTKDTLAYLEKKGGSIDPATVQTYEYYQNLAKTAVAALQDKKGEDIRVIDISGVTVIADYFIIASGSNPNQVQALVDNVEEQMYKAGYDDPRVEGYNTASWVLLDYNDVIVHVFSQDDRLFYDLERIWRDGKEIDVDSL